MSVCNNSSAFGAYQAQADVPMYANTSSIGFTTSTVNKNGDHMYCNLPNKLSAAEVESCTSSESAVFSHDEDLSPLKEFRNLRQNNFQRTRTNNNFQQRPPPDLMDSYIKRQTVENILKFQKQQRISNGNCDMNSHTSQSPQGLSKLSNPKNSLQRRDSGNSSGDRNSSSSSTSAENAFLTVPTVKRLLFEQPNDNMAPGNMRQFVNYCRTNMSDISNDSVVSLSSSDSYHSVNSSPAKVEPKLKQIPEGRGLLDITADVERKLKIVTKEDHGLPDCDKLCAEADLLYLKSQEKEKEGDLAMAALLSDSAAARTRAAMDAPYNSSRSLASAKMKHNMCVMRSSYLYRKLKDNESDDGMKSRVHHSRQSSRDSTHSRHSRQSSREGTITKQSVKDISNQLNDVDSNNKSIDIYGTLPKKGRKKQNSSSTNSSKAKDDQVYKDFLEKQRKNTNCSTSPVASCPPKVHNDLKIPEKISNNCVKNAGIKSPMVKGSEIPRSYREQKVNVTSVASGASSGKDTTSSSDKKQHKIRRKLLGGFLRLRNRSLPDLRVDQDAANDYETITFPKKPNTPSEKPKPESLGSDIANLSRGFVRPLHAFVKKNLSHKPLMKVNPPTISPVIVSNVSEKKICPPSLIPKKCSNPIPVKEQSPSSPISKIPLLSSYPKSPPTYPVAANSEVDGVQQQVQPESQCVQPSNIHTVPSLVDVTPAESNVLDFPTPSNPFLAEIQAKRKQILNCKDSGGNCLGDSLQSVSPLRTAKIPKINSQPMPLQVRKGSVVSPAADSLEASKNEHLEKLAMPHQLNVKKLPLHSLPGFINEHIPTASAEDFPGQPKTNSPKNVNVSPLKRREAPQGDPIARASRKLNFDDGLNNVSLDNTINTKPAVSFMHSDGVKEAPNDRNSQLSSSPGKRPENPPSYDNALQRLELLRTSGPGGTKNPAQVDVGKSAVSGQLSKSLEKKRTTKKKNVRFSDEVILVACAEYDDSGFFNNPLLGRVYQEHLDSGGKEVPQFNMSKECVDAVNEEEEEVHQLPPPPCGEDLTPCNLCRNKYIDPTSTYCVDCAFYMSQYQQ